MNNVLTLPPLLCGKAYGLLKLFVDEVKITVETSSVTGLCNVIVSLQWWGEILPVFLTPKIFVYHAKNWVKENTDHSATYHIKTIPSLFKEYLNTCNSLEFVILGKDKNYVIGSAFLKNLSDLLFMRSNFVALPLIDCLGEIIGEISIHLNISFEATSQCRNKKVGPHYLYKSNNNYCETTQISDENIGIFGHCFDEQNQLSISSNKFSEKNCIKKKTENLSIPDKKKLTNRNLPENLKKFNCTFNCDKKTDCKNLSKKTSENYNLPCLNTLTDSSKVISANLKGRKNNNSNVSTQHQRNNENTSSKYNQRIISSHNEQKCDIMPEYEVANKKIYNSKKKVTVNVKKKYLKEIQRNFTEKPKLSAQSFKKQIKSSDLNSSTHLLQYLLGYDMSIRDEELALNSLKEMSPSQQFVRSISEFCIEGNSDTCGTINHGPSSKSCNKNRKHLHFNFNNPVERRYYERFFVKRGSGTQQVTELTNKPKQDFTALEKDTCTFAKLDEKTCLLINNTNDISCSSKSDNGTICSKRSKMKTNSIANFSVTDNDLSNRNSCCEYYKKINELDKIIETLNHFENKILLDGKNQAKQKL